MVRYTCSGCWCTPVKSNATMNMSECWCSVLGGLSTLADSLITSLGMGLSIALKAGGGSLRWLWGAVVQWSEHLQLKQEALGSIPGGCPGFFFSFSWLILMQMDEGSVML